MRLGNEDITVGAPSFWLGGFYRLRNKIVHGEKVTREDLLYQIDDVRTLSQRNVAAMVFWEVVTWYLFEARRVVTGSYDMAKQFSNFAGQNEPDEAFVRYVAAGSLGIQDVHRALGWREEEAEST